MKLSFKVLQDPRLKLVQNMTQRFSEGPDSEELRILHTGYELNKELKKGFRIPFCSEIATHSNPSKGKMFSPVAGIVEEVGPRFLKIKVVEANPEDKEPKKYSKEEIQQIFNKENKKEALEDIRNLGINPGELCQSTEILLINALNPEPGMMWAEPLIGVHIRTLQAGLDLQIAYAKPKRVIIAAHKGCRISLPEHIEILEIDPVYPNSLEPLLIQKVTEKEKSKNIFVVSAHTLWGLGRVYETGLPLTETVVTLGTPTHSGNYIIKEGTRAIDILDHAHFPLRQGDTIVLGGPLRGASIAMPERGIPKHINGIFVIPVGSVPHLEGTSPCVNCGACTLTCPAKLSPDMISKFAEYALYDKCEEWYANYCMECGLCGFVCIARRPVLQYIRLAKQKLALQAISTLNKEIGNEVQNDG